MELKIKIREVYGQRLLYPQCDKSRLFCQLLGTKTIPVSHVRTIEALGYRFVIQDTLSI